MEHERELDKMQARVDAWQAAAEAAAEVIAISNTSGLAVEMHRLLRVFKAARKLDEERP